MNPKPVLSLRSRLSLSPYPKPQPSLKPRLSLRRTRSIQTRGGSRGPAADDDVVMDPMPSSSPTRRSAWSSRYRRATASGRRKGDCGRGRWRSPRARAPAYDLAQIDRRVVDGARCCTSSAMSSFRLSRNRMRNSPKCLNFLARVPPRRARGCLLCTRKQTCWAV